VDELNIARLIAATGAVLIFAPASFFIFRDPHAAFSNPVVWFALVGALMLVWTAIWQF
jgi:hypothetical protein